MLFILSPYFVNNFKKKLNYEYNVMQNLTQFPNLSFAKVNVMCAGKKIKNLLSKILSVIINSKSFKFYTVI